MTDTQALLAGKKGGDGIEVFSANKTVVK